MVASLAYRKSFDRRPRYPLALSRTLLRRSLLAGALVALGIVVVRLSPDPHAQVVVFRFVLRSHLSHQLRTFPEQVEDVRRFLSGTAGFFLSALRRLKRVLRPWRDGACVSHFWTPTNADGPRGLATLCRSLLS